MQKQTEEKKLSRQEMIKRAKEKKDKEKINADYKTEATKEEAEEMVKKGIIE